jgi:hypothetical protein
MSAHVGRGDRVNCDLAGRLLDGYLENELAPRDRLLLEKHIAACHHCAEDLRRRPAFERDVRRSLAVSVRSLALPSTASTRIVQAAEQSLRRAVRARRAAVTFRLVQIPIPARLKSIALSPANKPVLSESRLGMLPAESQPAPHLTNTSTSWVPRVSFRLEPIELHAGEPYTVTVFLKSEAPEPVEAVHLDMDISGPSGFYRFGWTVEGPLPARDVTVFRITPELLAEPCKEEYLISPADVFGFPGVYTVRLIVSDPVVASQ